LAASFATAWAAVAAGVAGEILSETAAALADYTVSRLNARRIVGQHVQFHVPGNPDQLTQDRYTRISFTPC
jgi:hypothetical protein